jgi:hypothetical protein
MTTGGGTATVTDQGTIMGWPLPHYPLAQGEDLLQGIGTTGIGAGIDLPYLELVTWTCATGLPHPAPGNVRHHVRHLVPDLDLLATPVTSDAQATGPSHLLTDALTLLTAETEGVAPHPHPPVHLLAADLIRGRPLAPGRTLGLARVPALLMVEGEALPLLHQPRGNLPSLFQPLATPATRR